EENLCRFLEMPGLTPGRQGGLAEFLAVPEHTVVPLPASVPLDVASVLSCAYGTCFHALRNRANVRAGERLAVFGCGGLGLAAVQLAATFGAAQIVAVDLLDAKLEMAAALGATHRVNAAEADPVAEILELTDQQGVDLVLEATPEPELRASLEVTRRGGRVVVIGLHPLGTRVPLHMMGFSMYNLSLIASLGYSPTRDLPPLIDLVASGRLDPKRLVTRAFDLDHVNEAYEALKAGEVARAIVRVR
ncbi:MAG: zinc-binding dehydrogenase, partial [Thermoplasmata archaeon]|nr:zinc-binding dehydrogenase [Thermoplasmata archaeon]